MVVAPAAVQQVVAVPAAAQQVDAVPAAAQQVDAVPAAAQQVVAVPPVAPVAAVQVPPGIVSSQLFHIPLIFYHSDHKHLCMRGRICRRIIQKY